MFEECNTKTLRNVSNFTKLVKALSVLTPAKFKSFEPQDGFNYTFIST